MYKKTWKEPPSPPQMRRINLSQTFSIFPPPLFFSLQLFVGFFFFLLGSFPLKSTQRGVRVLQAISKELDQACRSGSSSLSAGSARRDSTVGPSVPVLQEFTFSGTARRDSTVRILNWARPGVSVRQEFSGLRKAWQDSRYSCLISEGSPRYAGIPVQSHKAHQGMPVLHFNLTSLTKAFRYFRSISQGPSRHGGTPVHSHKAHQGMMVLQFNLTRLTKACRYFNSILYGPARRVRNASSISPGSARGTSITSFHSEMTQFSIWVRWLTLKSLSWAMSMLVSSNVNDTKTEVQMFRYRS
jgi:hypothetical protein